MEKIKKLKAHQELDNRKKFGKKLLNLVPELEPYVSHRLYVATSLGIIPENMYSAQGIIDDAVISIFESDLSRLTQTTDLRLEMFKLVKNRLDTIFQKEAWHQKSISTDKILHQELNKLKEKYTFNADEDFIMNEELSDISYRQKDFSPQLFLYDDYKQNLINAFDIDGLHERRKKLFTRLYSVLSMEASNVVDLYVFGKLNTSEIAQIKYTDEPTIREIILQVKDRIQKVGEQH